MFRQLHRWTSLPLILFLLLVTATGVLLQFEELEHLGGEERGAPPETTAMPADAAIAAQLSNALAKAREAEPEFRPTRIELGIVEGRQTTRLAAQPRGGPFVEVDHASGKVRAEMNPEMPLHVILIRLHTGSLFGGFGIVVILLSSLVLLFLAVSGAVLYWQMWTNRKSRGMPKLFWK
ncbi:MAG: PepSY domain-containing protein [Sphingomonadaceae bacterium]|jgi:uncharacterized iron-regulated membrane protein